MPYCPRCLAEYQEGEEACWSCRVQLAHGSLDERVRDAAHGESDGSETPSRDWVKLVAAYLAPDELSALRIQALLEEAGIEARVESVQIPWIDGVMSNIKGYWGRVLVRPEDAEASRELVADYVASLGDGDQER
jgi:hypothetical protein